METKFAVFSSIAAVSVAVVAGISIWTNAVVRESELNYQAALAIHGCAKDQKPGAKSL